jgi:hypothetical protein
MDDRNWNQIEDSICNAQKSLLLGLEIVISSPDTVRKLGRECLIIDSLSLPSVMRGGRKQFPIMDYDPKSSNGP